MSDSTFRLKVWVTERGGPGIAAKRIRGVIKDSLFEAVKLWHQEMMPRHFTVRGATMYAYQKRRGEGEPAKIPNPKYAGNRNLGFRTTSMMPNLKYWHVKRRAKGHTRPLVHSGASEQAARRQIRITGTSKSARGTLAMPKYFYQYQKVGSRGRSFASYNSLGQYVGRLHSHVSQHQAPDKADELLRTTATERQQLNQKMRGHAMRTIAGIRDFQRRKIS